MQYKTLTTILLAAVCCTGYATGNTTAVNFFNIGPDLGAESRPDGSDLLTNVSSGNTDYAVLGFANKLEQTASTNNEKYPSAHLTLSGGLVGVAQKDMNHNSADAEAISTAGFNALLQVLSVINIYGSTEISSNNAIKLKDSFVTIGNLQASPVYFTVGRYYVPFGSYASNIISSIEPLSVALGAIHANTVTLGYHPDKANTFVASTFVFQQTVLQKNTKPGFGMNVGANNSIGKLHSSVDISYVNDLADSVGISSLYTTQSKLSRQVGGGDISLNVAYKNYGLLTGYVSALTSFAKTDMTYQSARALPSALHTEAYYAGRVFDKLNNFGLGLTNTFDALAINLPQRRIYVEDTINIFTNLNIGAQIDLDHNYSKNALATYASTKVTQDGQTHVGGYLQLGYYF